MKKWEHFIFKLTMRIPNHTWYKLRKWTNEWDISMTFPKLFFQWLFPGLEITILKVPWLFQVFYVLCNQRLTRRRPSVLPTSEVSLKLAFSRTASRGRLLWVYRSLIVQKSMRFFKNFFEDVKYVKQSRRMIPGFHVLRQLSRRTPCPPTPRIHHSASWQHSNSHVEYQALPSLPPAYHEPLVPFTGRRGSHEGRGLVKVSFHPSHTNPREVSFFSLLFIIIHYVKKQTSNVKDAIPCTCSHGLVMSSTLCSGFGIAPFQHLKKCISFTRHL